jgi:hypothetical protein
VSIELFGYHSEENAKRCQLKSTLHKENARSSRHQRRGNRTHMESSIMPYKTSVNYKEFSFFMECEEDSP